MSGHRKDCSPHSAGAIAQANADQDAGEDNPRSRSIAWVACQAQGDSALSAGHLVKKGWMKGCLLILPSKLLSPPPMAWNLPSTARCGTRKTHRGADSQSLWLGRATSTLGTASMPRFTTRPARTMVLSTLSPLILELSWCWQRRGGELVQRSALLRQTNLPSKLRQRRQFWLPSEQGILRLGM